MDLIVFTLLNMGDLPKCMDKDLPNKRDKRNLTGKYLIVRRV